MGKKSGPKAPPAPDPVATAAAQSQANKEAAVAQANLNRIEQYTPQGSIRYEQYGKNEDGTPQYRQIQSYNPEQQQLYNQEVQADRQLNQLAINNMGRVAQAQSKSFNYDGMSPMVTRINNTGPRTSIGPTGQVQTGVGPNDFSADAKRIADAVYGQATSRLDPRFQQEESDMRSQLAAKGISENSDAYRREMDNFTRGKTDAYNQAQFSAQQAGANEQSRIFGLDLQKGNFANSAQDQRFSQELAKTGLYNEGQTQKFNQDVTNANLQNTGRQQQIQEATYLRNLPINEIAALLGTGGTVQNPQFSNVSQVGVAPPDYQGAVYNNYNAAMQQWQQKMSNRSAGLGSIFGAAGSLGAAAVSDRRLKHGIRRVGTLANGIATYVFSYVGESVRHFGVMAQDVLKIRPEAVLISPSGYLAVDYRKAL